MEILQKPVNEIKPDPKQPRQTVIESNFMDLGKSLLSDGIINPVEIDKDDVIVTGELRWRAAKEVGIETIPVKVITVKDNEERFLRQYKEDVHQYPLTAMDNANALRKILEKFMLRTSSQDKAPKSGITADQRYHELARLTGKSEGYIRGVIHLPEEPEEIKEAVITGKVGYTLVREANKAPKEFRARLKEKILSGDISNQEGVVSVARALNRDPEKAEELLEAKYKGKGREETINLVNTIAPSPITQIENQTENAEMLIRSADNFQELLSKNKYSDVPPLMRPKVKMAYEGLVKSVAAFLSNTTVKEIEKEQKKQLLGGSTQ